MNSEAKKKIFVGVLFAVLGVVLVYQLFIKGTAPTPTTTAGAAKKPAAATATATAKAAAKKASAASAGAATAEGEELDSAFQNVTVDIDTLLKDIEVVNFDYEAEHIDRNPMSPLVGIVRPQLDNMAAMPLSKADVLRKSVTGIIYSQSDPAAVIDEEVVNEGFVYPDGTVVQDIEPDRVIFKVGDSLIPVEMKKIGAGQ